MHIPNREALFVRSQCKNPKKSRIYCVLHMIDAKPNINIGYRIKILKKIEANFHISD